MAAVHPLWSFRRGDTFPIAGCCADAVGAPLDLTGATIEWKLQSVPADSDLAPAVVLDLTNGVAGGIAVTNEMLGELAITITAAQSAALIPGRYRDQLRVTLAGGTVSTQWVGFIDILESF